ARRIWPLILTWLSEDCCGGRLGRCARNERDGHEYRGRDRADTGRTGSRRPAVSTLCTHCAPTARHVDCGWQSGGLPVAIHSTPADTIPCRLGPKELSGEH